MEQRPFSERMDLQPPRKIQAAGMDSDLRHSIWNVLFTVFERDSWQDLAEGAAIGCLKVPANLVPVSHVQAREWLALRFRELEWYRVYDLLEFVAAQESLLRQRGWTSARFIDAANDILGRELSGFRFVRGILTPLTGEQEVQAIEEAAHSAGRAGLGGVEMHLDEALRLLGRRPEPDYRNSVKESISAIESAVSAMAGLGKPDLDEAIRLLREKGLIHGAMAAAFVKLFAYTSDDDGIRHAILDQPTVGYDEAKFILVACSAFAHFLIAKASAAGLLKA